MHVAFIRERYIYTYMEFILFDYIWTILVHISRNNMVLQFEVALNIEKPGLTTSVHKKKKFLSKQPNSLTKVKIQNFLFNKLI